MLIMRAYHLQDFQIAGGPDWLRNTGFDIEAKGDPSATREQLMLMLQSLLEQRFQYHRETHELPVYTLSVAKGGPKLEAPKEGGCVKPDDPPPADTGTGRCGVVSLVTGAAGLTERGGDSRRSGAPPNILVALQEHLGLTLERAKGPAEVMVIDHVEKPDAN